MSYDVRWTPRALKEADRLDARIRARVFDAVGGLSVNPRSVAVKKLVARRDLYRLRVGDIRVLFEIHDGALVVLVLSVGHRSEAYD